MAVPVLAVSFARTVSWVAGAPTTDPRRAKAFARTRNLVQALEVHRRDHGRLPAQEKGLEALVPERLPAVPRDPWGNPYVYALSSDGMWADVLSYGADGRPGGGGPNADLSGRFGSLQGRPSQIPEVLGHAAFLAVLLVGFFGSGRWDWATGLLVGSGGLCSFLLFTVLSSPLRLSPLGLLASGSALACLTGTLALLRRLPGAAAVALATALAAYGVLGKLLTD